MTSLDPHVLLVTRASQPSRTAVLLGQGGYLVTKTHADHALASVNANDPDAIVIDLPVFDELAVVRALESVMTQRPILVISIVPRRYPNRYAQRYSLHRDDIDDDLITAVDRMLVDIEAAA